MAVLRIGKYCSIAANSVWDLGFQHYYKAATTFPMHILKDVPSNVWVKGDIEVRNDVWISNNCTIMGGVTICDGAVIGANETVRRDIEPYEIYTGSKKPEKFRFTKEIIDQLLRIRWWDWEESRILTNADLLVSHNIENFLNNHI